VSGLAPTTKGEHTRWGTFGSSSQYDYTFGHSSEAQAKNADLASGGKVSGAVRHPLNNQDFSSFLLQAQASGAKVVALAKLAATRAGL
jgi:hypothetical protein